MGMVRTRLSAFVAALSGTILLGSCAAAQAAPRPAVPLVMGVANGALRARVTQPQLDANPEPRAAVVSQPSAAAEPPVLNAAVRARVMRTGRPVATQAAPNPAPSAAQPLTNTGVRVRVKAQTLAAPVAEPAEAPAELVAMAVAPVVQVATSVPQPVVPQPAPEPQPAIQPKITIPPSPPGVPSASKAAGMTADWSKGSYLAWIKAENRLYLVRDNVIVQVMLTTDNDVKTPVGDYSIYTRTEWTTSVAGGRYNLHYFQSFYRRPGATGNIGIHEVGQKNGRRAMDMTKLGVEGQVSDGCLRLSPDDAKTAWNFATLGTRILVR